MSFFNQKEDVLDIKLTQYGKRMLAKGKFFPLYYAFFDKGVIYNWDFCGEGEAQNEAEDRIKTGSPRLKTQYNFIGVETQFTEMKEIITDAEKYTDKQKKEMIQDTENTFFAIQNAVGTTQLDNEYNPSWKIDFYSESLSSASIEVSGNFKTPMKIPQLDAVLEYRTHVLQDYDASNIEAGDDKVYLPPDDAGSHQSIPLTDFAEGDHSNIFFEDGSAVIVKDDFILVGIDEKNTDFLHENFEIEVFKVEEYYANEKAELANEKSEKLVPLKFLDDEMALFTEDPSFVEYYFDIMVDDEIPLNVLCSMVPSKVKKNIYVKNIFDCDEYGSRDMSYANIYEDDELGEPC